MNVMRTASKSTNRWLFSIYTGFYAGLIWGAFKILEFYLKFTVIVPGFLVEPFYKHSYLTEWQGILIGWASFIVLSILASFIYGAWFYKVKGSWLGIVYGIVWWALICLLIGPLTGMMKPINQYDWNTIMAELCLYVVWGLFIGYTIALEFTDDRTRDTQSSTT